MRKRISIIGAAGKMTSVAARALLKRFPEATFALSDFNYSALQAIYGKMEGPRVRLLSVDIFQPDQLSELVGGSDLVINGAGPFYKTTAVVANACIAAGVDYLDIGDDIESTQDAIQLDQAAKRAGVALYIGCGASPGMTNLLAADLISRLDVVDSVEVAWVVGDEGPQDVGRAVVEHVIHIGAGDCLTWRNGKPFVSRSFVASTVLPLGGALGNYRLYECAHPETVTLPFSFTHIKNAWCWGGLHPQPANGLIMGVARAYRNGHITLDQACDFMTAVMAEKSGSGKVWRYAVSGMLGQVLRGENSMGNVFNFIRMALKKQHPPMLSGIMARAKGMSGDKSLTLSRSVPGVPGGVLSGSMANATGLPQAAFSSIVLQQKEKRTGTLFPEKIASLDAVKDELVAMGVDRSEVESPLLQTDARGESIDSPA